MVGTDVSISARIASHAAASPARLAVADCEASLSYAELHERSDQLAADLLDLGAGPEVCIGLFMERSAEFVIAALAVLKTGAAYLPLDSSAPTDRAAFILADAGVPLLLTHRRKTHGWQPGAWGIIELDGPDAAAISMRPARFDAVDPSPHSLAYVVYTSGSTGRPKGVEITHANLCNLIEWHQSAFGVTTEDRASQVAGLGFDAAVWEIWPHLAAGASLYIADETTRRSPHALRDWIIANAITISFVPTVLAEQLLYASWPDGTALRTLLTGADTLHRRPTAGLPFVLINNYGPTECTVVATSGAVPAAGADGPPSIGRSIDNTTVLILNDALAPASPGEAGELCIAGAGVGRGYRRNPELTASRFVTVTAASGEPMRIYRTGDRARLLENGEIAFLGRLDDQVKIRGYRIELGEIITCLDRCPGVEASAVLASTVGGPSHADNGNGESGRELIAYIVPARDAKLTASDLREFLAPRLPDYMIPSRFVTLTALPLTANGKLDKAALPAPQAGNLLPHRIGEDKAPTAADSGASAVEQKITAIVAALLGQPSVARDDNFFMIGGHSMFGVQLVARIRDSLGVKLSLRQLFGAPTVAALSTEVARLSQTAGKPT